MDRAFLEQLGLDVNDSDGVVEADLDLRGGQALNPLTRRTIDRVSFTVMGDRLLYVGPPEFVGAQPINLAFLSPGARLEDVVVQTLNEHLFQLERRSNELTALGINPKVDPATLQLTAEVERPPMKFVIGASRTGQFRLIRASNAGVELTNASQNVFELSEFFEKRALEEFLFAMYSDVVDDPRVAEAQAAAPATIKHSPTLMISTGVPEAALPFKELFAAFGDAYLPPRSPMEIVADVRVKDQKLRFAAARVQGKTFRGLLAGPSGKVWADRFELDEFPGIRGFVAELMNVGFDEIEVVNE
ncbi:MAG: hypothetical protein U0228_33910 [Myxococcaceae bacterium]